jgi:hypothetical protein
LTLAQTDSLCETYLGLLGDRHGDDMQLRMLVLGMLGERLPRVAKVDGPQYEEGDKGKPAVPEDANRMTTVRMRASVY